MSEPSVNLENPAAVPFPRLVTFVRQITHDVRNGLNAIDLQAAYIAEICGGGEVGEEMTKLRRMVGHVTKDMQELSGHFGEVRPVLVEYPLQEFMQGLRDQVAEEFDTQSKRIVWEIRAGNEETEMDYNLLMTAVVELIRNAIYFREGDHSIRVAAWTENGAAIFEVSQPRSQPVENADHWGRVPLNSSRRGGYGLGLFYVRRILDKLGGKLSPAYDAVAGELRVRLTLPPKGAGQPASNQ